MRTYLVAITVAVFTATVAYAATPQQEKMKTCNAEATQKGLKGSERQTFMSSCLSDSSAKAAELTPQQAKMKQCNADASQKGLKGADRKTFMSTCLSAH